MLITNKKKKKEEEEEEEEETKGSVNDVVPIATLSRLDPRSSSPSFIHGQPRSTAFRSSLVIADCRFLVVTLFPLTRSTRPVSLSLRFLIKPSLEFQTMARLLCLVGFKVL